MTSKARLRMHYVSMTNFAGISGVLVFRTDKLASCIVNMLYS